MSKPLLEQIELKKEAIREAAQEYFLLDAEKSSKMESHSVEGGQYKPIRCFQKTIPYRDFEKIIRGPR